MLQGANIFPQHHKIKAGTDFPAIEKFVSVFLLPTKQE